MGSNGSEHRPRIGLSTYVEPARWGVWDRPAALLPAVYVEGVIRAGGVPVLLPPAAGAAAAAVDGVHGLLLSGGADIEPARYGAEPHAKTEGWRRERDAWELDLLSAALDRQVPVLGLCRGAQLLNVGFGGTLVQHVPDQVGHSRHRPAPAVLGKETIAVTPGSRLADVLGREASVPCYHHQGIGQPGEGLVVVARSADGVVEAVERPGEPFVLGVQWHPEEDATDTRVLMALVDAARRRLTVPAV